MPGGGGSVNLRQPPTQAGGQMISGRLHLYASTVQYDNVGCADDLELP